MRRSAACWTLRLQTPRLSDLGQTASQALSALLSGLVWIWIRLFPSPKRSWFISIPQQVVASPSPPWQPFLLSTSLLPLKRETGWNWTLIPFLSQLFSFRLFSCCNCRHDTFTSAPELASGQVIIKTAGVRYVRLDIWQPAVLFLHPGNLHPSRLSLHLLASLPATSVLLHVADRRCTTRASPFVFVSLRDPQEPARINHEALGKSRAPASRCRAFFFFTIVGWRRH